MPIDLNNQHIGPDDLQDDSDSLSNTPAVSVDDFIEIIDIVELYDLSDMFDRHIRLEEIARMLRIIFSALAEKDVLLIEDREYRLYFSATVEKADGFITALRNKPEMTTDEYLQALRNYIYKIGFPDEGRPGTNKAIIRGQYDSLAWRLLVPWTLSFVIFGLANFHMHVTGEVNPYTIPLIPGALAVGGARYLHYTKKNLKHYRRVKEYIERVLNSHGLSFADIMDLETFEERISNLPALTIAEHFKTFSEYGGPAYSALAKRAKPHQQLLKQLYAERDAVISALKNFKENPEAKEIDQAEAIIRLEDRLRELEIEIDSNKKRLAQLKDDFFEIQRHAETYSLKANQDEVSRRSREVLSGVLRGERDLLDVSDVGKAVTEYDRPGTEEDLAFFASLSGTTRESGSEIIDYERGEYDQPVVTEEVEEAEASLSRQS